MTEPITQDSFCLLYAPDSGQIHFAHRVTTIGDMAPLTDEQIEAQARENMSATGRVVGREMPQDLAATIVSPDSFRPDRRYTVRDGELLAEPQPDPG